MKSSMRHDFAKIPSANIQRSSFNRSSNLKTTFDGGWLIPVFVDEALPGDTMNLRMSTFARLATPVHPFLDNLTLSSFFFAVPIRLIWWNWEEFNGHQFDPGDSIDFTIPQMVPPGGGHLVHSLSDYLGLPTKETGYTHSSLWHRAYELIWTTHFRNENCQDSQNHYPLSDGPDVDTNFPLKRRGKRHDYFTSALPWPQKGGAVDLPLGTTAPVDPSGVALTYTDGTIGAMTLMMNSSDQTASWSAQSASNVSAKAASPTGLRTDLTNATSATINQLRESMQIQVLLEKDARGGNRYVEVIKTHFGVDSPDQRLQRPEYLGGGVQNISITPVPQTSSTDGTSPQANLAAFGTSSGSNHSFVKSFTEHCVILGMVSVQADLTYQQGLDRQFSRLTRYDFYWPAFANLGEQSIKTKELFCDGSANDSLIFGYQERWAEYRHKTSKITGLFRSNETSSLDNWHLAEDFGSYPTLNDAFMQDDPPIDRVIVTQTEPHFLFDAHFNLTHVRPMPTYSVPGLGGRL